MLRIIKPFHVPNFDSVLVPFVKVIMNKLFFRIKPLTLQGKPLYLQGKTYDDCVHNVIDTVIQFDALGLVTHPEKSVFIPSQQLVILSFVLNSVTMTITLTQEKAIALQNACSALLNTASPTIREVARLLR